MSDEMEPDLDFQFGSNAPRPDWFNPNDWRVIKEGKSRVAARHILTDRVRKIPAHWLTER